MARRVQAEWVIKCSPAAIAVESSLLPRASKRFTQNAVSLLQCDVRNAGRNEKQTDPREEELIRAMAVAEMAAAGIFLRSTPTLSSSLLELWPRNRSAIPASDGSTCLLPRLFRQYAWPATALQRQLLGATIAHCDKAGRQRPALLVFNPSMHIRAMVSWPCNTRR